MRLVGDEDVEAVGVGVHELVEVAEERRRAGSAVAGHLAQRLGEGAGASGVRHPDPAPAQLAEQGEGDDALPTARAAGDDDDALVVAAPGLLDLVQDEVERHLLLVEQNELLAVLDLCRSMLQELL